MAIISAADFKTQTALMAAALTLAWLDDGETAVAVSISDPKHPLRKVDKFFNFNPATGVVTADDDYVDAAYAGLTPNKGSQLDKVTGFPLNLVSAAVADATPTIITLTYSRNLKNQHPAPADFVIGGTQSYLVTDVVVNGAKVSLVSASAFVNGETITITYAADSAIKLEAIKDGTLVAALSAEAVTNNVS